MWPAEVVDEAFAEVGVDAPCAGTSVIVTGEVVDWLGEVADEVDAPLVEVEASATGAAGLDSEVADDDDEETEVWCVEVDPPESAPALTAPVPKAICMSTNAPTARPAREIRPLPCVTTLAISPAGAQTSTLRDGLVPNPLFRPGRPSQDRETRFAKVYTTRETCATEQA